MSSAIDEALHASAGAPDATTVPQVKSSWRFRDMRLKVGDLVQVQPPAEIGVGRVSARVVGWVEGQSLLLTIPQLPLGRLRLCAGERMVVRAFTGRSAFAFSCTTLRGTARPSDYLYLSFPDRIDGVDVRSSPRFRLKAPARVTPAQAIESVHATIDNIGSTGAMLVCETALGAVGEVMQIAFDVVLHDIPVSLALRAEIKTADRAADSGQYRHGVYFFEPSRNDQLVLAALVWFNMYENPGLSA